MGKAIEHKRYLHVLCDVCSSAILLSDAIKVPFVDGEGNQIQLVLCARCYEELSGKELKYIMKRFKGGPPLYRGGGPIEQVKRDVEAVKQLFFGPRKRTLKRAMNVEAIRADVIAKLVDAINVIYHLAKSAPEALEKGQGGATKEKYYRVLGYLSQVLDGVLKSVEMDELKRRIEALEEALGEL